MNSTNVAQKIRMLNTLAFYFSNLPKQSFSQYVVVQGRTPRIYSKWISVIEQIKNFQNPLWKAFHNIHEALEFARKNIGISFHVDTKASMDSTKIPGPSQTPGSSSSYLDAVEFDKSRNLQFYRHCDSMVNNFRRINEKCRVYEDEIKIQKAQIDSLTKQLKEMHGIVGSQSGTIFSQISELGELKGRLSQITSHMASSSSGPILKSLNMKGL